MDWGQALIVATLAGQFFGMAARWLPFIPNVLAPKVTWIAATLANLVLVMQKFIESAGWGGVAWYVVPDSDVGLAGFGWFSLKGVAAIVGASLIAYVQTAFTRWVGEKGAKPVVTSDGQVGEF
jgi:hypothetical protein